MINRRFQEKSEKSNTNNSYIFIAKESTIDHVRCIRDLGFCYWWKKCGRGERHLQIGDIVYLFISDKIHNRVMYRLEVADTNSTRDDVKYWKTKFEPDNSCFKLQNVSPVYTGTGLTRDELEMYGIKRQILSKKLDAKQAAWLESHFVRAK